MALSTPTLGDFSHKGTGTTLAVDFPTGLAVGDLMLMHVVFSGAESATTPTDWTLVQTAYSGSTGRAFVYWKIATSGDVSAGNVTLTTDSGQTGAYTMRITGHDAVSPIGASSQAAGSGTDFNMGTITPAKITSLIFIFIGDDTDSASTTCSGYTNVTTPPTYTELYDEQNGELHMAAAYGLRTVATATGTLTANLSISNPGGGIAVAVSPADSSPTVTPSALSISGAIASPALVVDVILSAISTFLGITSAVPTPTPSVTNNPWTNQDKSSTSWTNQDKS